jgi:rhamnogalacturonyl hydrolase YesR
MTMKKLFLLLTACMFTAVSTFAQSVPGVPNPRGNQRPAQPSPLLESIPVELNRVLQYLSACTPTELVDRTTQAPVTDYTKIDVNTMLRRGQFGLFTYEWGVTYSAMLRAAEILNDRRYSDYVDQRFNFVGDIYPWFVKVNNEAGTSALRGLIAPVWLDDCGAMQAALVKGVLANPSLADKLRPIIETTFDFTMNKEHRLADGTLARLRPTDNSLWVDDMYMGIPPIAYMGKIIEKENPTAARKYYDEAARQIDLFKKYLWIPEKQLFRHSWIESMSHHPSLFWGRANGWALITMSDVLDILPSDHHARAGIMRSLIDHIHGIMPLQGGDGFFHQLLDRNDSYTETSITAMYAYAVAHAVNEGWVDIQTYGPSAVAAWRAVSTRINAQGGVEGTCVGTGVAYEPGFYYRRPTSVHAAHGYGPVILAGTEVLKMLRTIPKFY